MVKIIEEPKPGDLNEESLERMMAQLRERLGEGPIVIKPRYWFLSQPPELIEWCEPQDPTVWVSEGL